MSRLGDILLENKVISKQQLNQALEFQKKNKDQLLGQIFISLNIIKPDILIKYLDLQINNLDSSK